MIRCTRSRRCRNDRSSLGIRICRFALESLLLSRSCRRMEHSYQSEAWNHIGNESNEQKKAQPACKLLQSNQTRRWNEYISIDMNKSIDGKTRNVAQEKRKKKRRGRGETGQPTKRDASKFKNLLDKKKQ